MPKLYDWITYSGIAAFVCLLIGITAIFYPHVFIIHKIAGVLTFIFALIHAGLIVYRNLKRTFKK